jgi:NAD+ synthase (glutamine-hydrolysing)
MIIALCQLNYTVGNFEKDTQKIINSIHSAQQQGADLLVFSELAIGGFPAFDLYNSLAFKSKSVQAIEGIKKACKGIACLIGGVYESEEDKKLYNAAYFIENGEIRNIIRKKNLSSADWYSESRYFASGGGIQTIHFQNKKMLVAIGEDVQDIPTELGVNDFLINITATPFSYTSHSEKLSKLGAVTDRFNCPIFQINQVGGQGDLLFDGRSIVKDAEGKLVDELAAFKEEIRYYDIDANIVNPKSSNIINNFSEIGLIHGALLMGIKDFFEKQGFKKAVLGLSGGLDSALVAALTCEAIGEGNVLSILLPSVYSTEHSLKDALDLVENTGCKHEIIPIESAVSAIEHLLAPLFQGKEADLTEENIQARSRGLLLMAISNKLGHIVLNTSNKSEAAVGYGTLYGDMVGSISVIGDVYKTQAFELAKYINREREIIPLHTIIKPPSAELRPGQKDIDSLPDYSILDPILYQYIDMGKSPSDIIALGFEKSTVERIIRLVNQAEFKRFQAPPILRVSNKAFGRARIMPVVSKQ